MLPFVCWSVHALGTRSYAHTLWTFEHPSARTVLQPLNVASTFLPANAESCVAAVVIC